jgi:hypothetical protein
MLLSVYFNSVRTQIEAESGLGWSYGFLPNFCRTGIGCRSPYYFIISAFFAIQQ